MDPIRKAGLGPVAPGAGGLDQARGPGDNTKFEQVKNKAAGLQDAEKNASVSLPDPVQGVNPQEQKQLLSDLRRRVETSGARSPQELFRAEVEQTRVTLQKLRKQVDALPRDPGANTIRERLETIESSFTGAEQMLAGMRNLDSPKELLRMQIQLYNMTQNIEMVSKVVEQLSGGTKQLLQTQI
jgi:hypothetical protein